jgi:predicted PurR-regulated permease PerM
MCSKVNIAAGQRTVVWIPAGLFSFASQHPTKAIIELAWGALIIVGSSDYVLRRWLMGDEDMSTVLVFIALFED